MRFAATVPCSPSRWTGRKEMLENIVNSYL